MRLILEIWRYRFLCFVLFWFYRSWWRHQMDTFSALLVLCVGNPSVNVGFPSQRPETRRFDVFFELRLNKRLGKQSRRWWFQTPSRSLWRHSYAIDQYKTRTKHHKARAVYIILTGGFPSQRVSFIIYTVRLPYTLKNRCQRRAFVNTFWGTVYQHLTPLLKVPKAEIKLYIR